MTDTPSRAPTMELASSKYRLMLVPPTSRAPVLLRTNLEYTNMLWWANSSMTPADATKRSARGLMNRNERALKAMKITVHVSGDVRGKMELGPFEFGTA
jgi:hypothetical protein